MTEPLDSNTAKAQVARFQETFARLQRAVHELIVGQDEVVDGVLTAVFAGGHVLLEGVPGIGKTMLVKTLGEALHLQKGRVQFTPDLMPADVLGTMVLEESQGHARSVRFQPGPIHTNLLLADEINRATPKTQSALLEAMQEQQVTVGGQTRALPQPFVVLATQNPVEQEGTYPLPEAQLDRFLFKLLVGYPKEHEYAAILQRTTGGAPPAVTAVASGDDVLAMRKLVRAVPVPEAAQRLAVRLVMATQPKSPYATERVDRFVQLGSSPRGAQALVLAGKVQALRGGRFAVSGDDVLAAAVPALRHRMLLNFEGLGEGLTADDLVREILERRPALESAR
ncbi:MAG: MoxR family ATPase [Planctomycetes bacterium]|nr:MoxR family ATPase [Planctomycetota bacterium]